jgi:Family of unknown function (DUF5923)
MVRSFLHPPIRSVDLPFTPGQKLVQDIRDIIHTAKLMVGEKNADELFQNFVWHTQGASKEVNVQNIVGEAKGSIPDAEKTKKDGEDGTPFPLPSPSSSNPNALLFL